LNLLDHISRITKIDNGALSNEKDLNYFCIAQKMSWASRRQTTRVEDMAYSLLGIFGINMPMLYGEGHKAFYRLQEEIIRRSGDDSIFAWGLSDEGQSSQGPSPPDTLQRVSTDRSVRGYSILASSPMAFRNSGGLRCPPVSHSTFSMTNIGMQIELPLCETPEDTSVLPYHAKRWVGILGCSFSQGENCVGIILRSESDREIIGIDGQLFVQQAAFDYPTLGVHTIAVGLDTVMESHSRKVVIVDGSTYQGFEPNRELDTKVLVNETPAFLNVGLHVGACEGIQAGYWGSFGPGCKMTWNPETMVLNLEDLEDMRVLLKFDIVSRASRELGLLLIVQPDSGSHMVRAPGSVTVFQLHSLYESMGVGWRDDDVDEVLRITDDDGALWDLAVTVEKKFLYSLRLYKVTIDATLRGA
jgi:hypothetical protein